MPTPTDVVEALLFASDTPLEAERIREVLDLPDVHEAGRLIEELRARYEAIRARACRSSRSAADIRMITRPEVAPWLVRAGPRPDAHAPLAAGARGAGDRRLQAAGVASRDRRGPRRQLRGRCSTTSSSGGSSASPGGKRRPVGRTSSRRRASSWSPSACVTSVTCRRSRASWSSRSWRPSPSMVKLRLNKILAQAGLTSRRGGDRLIVDGHVAVNGVVTRSPPPSPIPTSIPSRWTAGPAARRAKRYVLLNKPRGYVTTLRDPQGRPVVADLVARDVRLYPVGRLDWDVEGALLLTNDGPLTHRLLHPRYALPRVYEARVRGSVTDADPALAARRDPGRRAGAAAGRRARAGRSAGESAPPDLRGRAQARGQAILRGPGSSGAGAASHRLRSRRTRRRCGRESRAR